MRLRRLSIWTFALSSLFFGIGVVFCQTFPSKPIRIVTGSVGGGSDFTSRLVAQGLAADWGQQVIVDNRGGASGASAVPSVAKAPADGYMLLLYGSPLWLLPYLRTDTPWDPVRDFAPITLAVITPNIFAVHPSLPVKSVREFIAFAKARPGELNYASGSTGGPSHLPTELFRYMAGVNIVRVAYKGAGPALIDLIGGQVQLMLENSGAVMPHVKSGKLRALAVTSAEPSALAPGLPTVASSGLPGYEAVTIFAVFAPARTPETVIAKLHQEIANILNRADSKQRLLNVGVEAIGSSPEQLSIAMKSEMARLGKVIKEAGIRAE